jgi:hypothetical protein
MAADAPINAGEDSFGVEDAGSDPVAVKPPEGERWVDVNVVMRFKVQGEADADMVATAVHGALSQDPAYLTMSVGSGTQFESIITPMEIVKLGGVEQGIKQ